MVSERTRRIAAGVVVAAALLAAWPAFSAAWTGALTRTAVALAPVRTAYVTSQSSVLLPIVAGVIVALPVPLRRRGALLSIAAAATLGGELAIMLLGAIAPPPDFVMQVLRGLVQYVIPMTVVLLGMRESQPS